MADFTTGWVTQRLCSGDEIRAFDRHPSSNRYVLGIRQEAEFKLPKDELHPEWSQESVYVFGW